MQRIIMEETMKTRIFLILLPAVFTMVAILFLCNSVGLAREPIISQDTYIDSQIIMTKEGKRICVKLDPVTQCGKPVNCDTGEYIEKGRIPATELFRANYIEVPGSPCNSFTADVPGNTRYYCSGGYCYPY